MTGGKREFRSKGVNWPCLSPKDMKEKYQNKTYAVIGEVGAKAIKEGLWIFPLEQKILKAAPAGNLSRHAVIVHMAISKLKRIRILQ